MSVEIMHADDRYRLAAGQIERFWRKVQPATPDECWLWISRHVSRKGYGVFDATLTPLGERRKNIQRKVAAHRVAYQLCEGELLASVRQLDHLCRVHLCVNPEHLEPVTLLENIARGRGWTHQAEKTHCPRRHPYNDANTYVRPRGWRDCRTCRIEAREARQLVGAA